MTAEPLYLPDGDLFIPTLHTRGPWDAGAQHGGAPAALLARALEAVAAPAPVAVVRLTVEIFRPVPLAPLRVQTTTLRPGRRVQLLQATALAGDDEVCRATALRIRTTEQPVPDDLGPAEVPPPGPEHGTTQPADDSGEPWFGATGCELRFVRGRFHTPGPATAWIRLRRPVVAGETPSPLMRVAAAADFGNGLSALLDWHGNVFINPDLTVYLHRHPAGEWVCLDARTRITVPGHGLAESALWDSCGPIGRSLQALYVDVR